MREHGDGHRDTTTSDGCARNESHHATDLAAAAVADSYSQTPRFDVHWFTQYIDQSEKLCLSFLSTTRPSAYAPGVTNALETMWN